MNHPTIDAEPTEAQKEAHDAYMAKLKAGLLRRRLDGESEY